MEVIFPATLLLALALLFHSLLPNQIKEWVLIKGHFTHRRYTVPKVFSKRSKKTKTVSMYTNRDGIEFRMGETVRLLDKAMGFANLLPEMYAGKPVIIATIVSLLPDAKGLVQVKPKLGGYWTWSVEDLGKV